ncbi:VOC family protein [Cyanobacteria bacterium FACHB-63]|nr:VOC family protein [Cyanobacteria bacterium FACHB-63]
MWINTINHIQITSPPDVEEEMRFFYNDVLGLPEFPKPEVLQPNGGAWYQLGEIQLHISTEKDARNYASKRHICFQVRDLSAFQQHLAAHQISIIPDGQPIEGYDRFYLRDPGGNRIEIIAPELNQ